MIKRDILFSRIIILSLVTLEQPDHRKDPYTHTRSKIISWTMLETLFWREYNMIEMEKRREQENKDLDDRKRAFPIGGPVQHGA